MKINPTYWIWLLSSLLLFLSCTDDEGGNNGDQDLKNTFTYKGTTYKIDDGVLNYLGEYNSSYFTLELKSNDFEYDGDCSEATGFSLSIRFFNSNNETIDDGVYEVDGTFNLNSIFKATISIFEGENCIVEEELLGSMTVTFLGSDKYEIEIAFIDGLGFELIGNYEELLSFIDSSDEQCYFYPNSWGLGENSTVFRDSDDLTTDYSGFTITFLPSNMYSITGDVNGIFSSTSGTWKFLQEDQIGLNDDTRPITISPILGCLSLSMEFSISNGTPIGGRTNGLDGDYVFNDLVLK